jgi:amphi-Trp domain-containing protein
MAKKQAEKEVEKSYSSKQTIAKLRRLAEALDEGRSFRIQVAGERIVVPKNAEVSIEFEREDGEEELQFEIKWKK